MVDHALVDPARGGRRGWRSWSRRPARPGSHWSSTSCPTTWGWPIPRRTGHGGSCSRSGPTGEFAAWFDVDWAAADGRVLLPVLADDFDPERDLTIEGAGLRYGDHLYPLAAGTRHSGRTAASVHLRQHYRLIGDRLADTDLNYRRFFAISDLAGLRVEDPAVFDATHREILRWVTDYGVRGIRIDHPDGLAAPGEYLRAVGRRRARRLDRRGEDHPARRRVACRTGPSPA